MKITIEDKQLRYVCDFDFYNKEDRGFVCQYEPSVREVVDNALELIACMYSHEQVADYLTSGHVPAKDYAAKEK